MESFCRYACKLGADDSISSVLVCVSFIGDEYKIMGYIYIIGKSRRIYMQPFATCGVAYVHCVDKIILALL